jgi:PadR family transcriptional regulator, regulatory protein PadR
MLSKQEEMLAQALLKIGPDTTAGDLQAAISDATGREQAFGAVFTTLDRMTDKRFVRWRKGEPDARRGGRAPRLYTLTGAGKAALIANLRATQVLSEGTPGLPGLAGAKAGLQ